MKPVLILLGLCPFVVTLGYIALCSVSPWGTCQRYHAHRRTCMRCDGTGMRPRLGWQLNAYARHTYRDGIR
jgi:hypothetical protein